MTPEEKEALRQKVIQLDKSLQEVFARLEELRRQETDEETKQEKLNDHD
jgi:hypothetical protein